MGAGRFACVADGDDTGDFSECEARGLRGTNEVQARCGRLVIVAIPIALTPRWRQESSSLVEPDRLRGHTADSGQIADLHVFYFTT